MSGRYLEKDDIGILKTYKDEIYRLRTEAFEKYGIDLLDTDALSSVEIYETVSQYDLNYNVNFSRNGEDGISDGVVIEQKCSKIKKETNHTSFAFHAMGDIEYPRYILAARLESTLKITRIYDISLPENTDKIKTHLHSLRQLWLDKGQIDKKNMKYDVIRLPESLLLSLNLEPARLLNNCIVRKG